MSASSARAGRRASLRALGALGVVLVSAACLAPLEEPLEFERLGDEGAVAFELSMPRVVEGDNELRLWLREARTQAPLAGLTLAVEAVHVEMGHGLDDEPEVQLEAGGSYLVRRLALHMPGRWSISVSVRGYDLSDHLSFDVIVR